MKLLQGLFHFFPVQLLINHLKKNKILLLFWLLLYGIVSNKLSTPLGLYHLFLDPEYLGQSSFISFFILGVALGGFIMAFHFTTYIIDIHKFTFVGATRSPFIVFFINNSPIPIIFLVNYLSNIIHYQLIDEHNEPKLIALKCAGILTGIFLTVSLILLYAALMDKELPRAPQKHLIPSLREALLRRMNKLRRLLWSEKRVLPVKSYINLSLNIQSTSGIEEAYNHYVVLRMFYRSHFNLIIFELVAISIIVVLGLLSSSPISQIPAAATIVVFISIIVVFVGFISFWAKSWTNTVVLILVLLVDMASKHPWVLRTRESHAIGLCYDSPPAEYSPSSLRAIKNEACYEQDKAYTLQILENWRKKFPADTPPKLVIICASGGGLFSGLGTFNTLQKAERLTKGKLMKHTMLMSCVSGGTLGAAYFRELYLRQQQGQISDLYAKKYLDKVACNTLNAVMFNFIINDLFLNLKRVKYNNRTYRADRGFVLEEQTNKYTDYVFSKPLKAYKAPEYNSIIPMMFFYASVNDGSKLYMSPHQVSYMTTDFIDGKVAVRPDGEKGIDFMRFFRKHNAENIRFASVIRMNSSFPYALSEVTLPSTPPIEARDCGLSDNYGISDAVIFMHVFKDWIAENTSGVVLMTIRGHYPLEDQLYTPTSLLGRLTKPIGHMQEAFFHVQEIRNNIMLEQAASWLKVPMTEIAFLYTVSPPQAFHKSKEAPVGWYLTTREKKIVIDSINSPENRKSLQKLKEILE